MGNAIGSFENKAENTPESFVTINTIDQTVYVERLPDTKAMSRDKGDVLYYGGDNLYPNKVKSMGQRSQSTMSAIKQRTRFTAGQGFKEQNGVDINKIIVNREGQTLGDILDHAANEKASFGVPIHFNYNQFGEIIEIQEIPFETLRWSYEQEFLIFSSDWSRTNRFSNRDRLPFFKFNPETVLEEIAAVGGIHKYTGQVLYWIPKRKETYPLAQYDSALDDTQFEHESGVYKLRNIQNGYNVNYLIIAPSQIESELEKAGIANEVQASRGANNSGKSKIIPVNNSAFEALGSRSLIEAIPKSDMDKLFQIQNEETKFNIYSVFNQPPILSGISKDGMFNAASYKDAFDYYNSLTEKDRQETERIFNSFMPFTVWKLDNLEIEPLSYGVSEGETTIVENEGGDAVSSERAKAQANLKGTVGGVTGILSIQDNVSRGVTQYDAGLEILMEIYGFEDSVARKILGAPIDLKQTDETVEDGE